MSLARCISARRREGERLVRLNLLLDLSERHRHIVKVAGDLFELPDVVTTSPRRGGVRAAHARDDRERPLEANGANRMYGARARPFKRDRACQRRIYIGDTAARLWRYVACPYRITGPPRHPYIARLLTESPPFAQRMPLLLSTEPYTGCASDHQRPSPVRGSGGREGSEQYVAFAVSPTIHACRAAVTARWDTQS
jgi:hypothetical protein